MDGSSLEGVFTGLFKEKGSSEISVFDEDDDEYMLLNEGQVHQFIGISKEAVRTLVRDHSDVPHLMINNNVYYPKEKQRQWLLNLE
ncbi:DNA-binding protein [Virgibacillus sp. C22-A2]|uniref:DNA-binding protein n=1 Tax=Virgibacillus tibetensis TaxID=3042313 RepID=A0ABU6KHW9_9BACI|nr:DNA-binding protein [Virgibacillus sp. C22-A2]